jgi:hypothetical protein
VVFGQVLRGKDIVEKIHSYGNYNGKPTKRVEISDCGIISRDKFIKLYTRPKFIPTFYMGRFDLAS